MAKALPPIVYDQTWSAALDNLREREQAATRARPTYAGRRDLPDIAAAYGPRDNA
jgi:hypothetical protein